MVPNVKINVPLISFDDIKLGSLPSEEKVCVYMSNL
jgi:hypothetical protein